MDDLPAGIGDKLFMVAIGDTDVLFTLDSIPAIFGLTQNVFLVFTVTARTACCDAVIT